MEEGVTYAAIDDALIPCIVVDVDCYAAESGDFGGKFVEAGVVLSVVEVYVSWVSMTRGREDLLFAIICAGHGV